MYIDSHIHVGLGGGDNTCKKIVDSIDEKRMWIQRIFRAYKEKKIFALRDGGDNQGFSMLARSIAKEEGILYKTPGYALYKKGFYGAFLGKAILDLSDFKREFKLLLKEKPDHFKIPLTGIVSFQQYGQIGPTAFTQEELTYMTKAAQDQGLPVMVHANGSEAVNMAVLAGVDTIEHGYFMGERELYGLGEKGIVWIPTLAPLGNLVELQDEKFKKELDIIEKIYQRHLELLYCGYQLKIKIAVGSDAGAYGVAHGTGYFDEVRHFIRMGLKEEEIHNLALENGVAALGLTAEEISCLKRMKG